MRSLLRTVPLIGALLLFSGPVKSEENGLNQDTLNGYSFGYIYGAGYTYCELVVQKQITKEYAKSAFEETFKAIMKDPKSEVSGYHAELSNKSITVDEDCKEVYQ